MWLLDVRTFKLCYFESPSTAPNYAILSHTWSKDEVLYKDILEAGWKKKAGAFKIYQTCKQARDDGYEYAWIDTCCIDKSSSAELSEAINSMFEWYRLSAVCYVYLEDATAREPSSDLSGLTQIFETDCRWWSRGWTLQELIAPTEVRFYDWEWKFITTRRAAASEISNITGIDVEVLIARHLLFDYCVADRLSWAAQRHTSRVEDQAYCLLGILGVNMPLLYGEGQRAFTRLQQEFIRVSSDLTIFAWGAEAEVTQGSYSNMIAPDVSAFSHTKSFQWLSHRTSDTRWQSETTVTNAALRITGPVLKTKDGGAALLLDCHQTDDFTKLVGLRLNILDGSIDSPENARGAPETIRCTIRPTFRTSPYMTLRLTYFDAFDVDERVVAATVVFAEETRGLGRSSPPNRSPRFAWVRFDNDNEAYRWSIMATFPERLWNASNMTFDLVRAKWKRHRKQLVIKSGVIVLEDDQGVAVAIVIGVPLADQTAAFGVVRYNPSESLGDAIAHRFEHSQDAQTLDLQDGRSFQLQASPSHRLFQHQVDVYTIKVSSSVAR